MTGAEVAAASPAPLRAERHAFVPTWARIVLANGKARVGLGILAFLVVASIVGPWLTRAPDVTIEVRTHPPSGRFLFGTTNEGFDVFAQVVHGGRLTLLTVAGATIIAMTLAVAAGLLSGLACFWFAYVLTRPLGASFADWTGKLRDAGGLGIGDLPVATALVCAIALIVGYLTWSRRDQPFPRFVPEAAS